MGEIEVEGKTKLMSVLFVQHTPKSELAKRIRNKLETLERVGNLKFKVVEKTGRKIEEILHRSDSWSNRDCGREECLICQSAAEEERKGMCKRRNIVYETYCKTCYEKERSKKEETEIHNINCEEVQEMMLSSDKKGGKRKRGGEEETKKDKKKEMEKKTKKEYTVKYVGETGRSGFERGNEHISDFLNFED